MQKTLPQPTLLARRTSGIFPILLIVIGAAMFLTGVWLSLSGGIDQSIGVAPLPGKLADLPRSASLLGEGALEEINQMHSKTFRLVSAAVGYYGDQHEITLWVSGASSKGQAYLVLEEMRTKIAKGRSPFQPVETRQDGVRSIYILIGLGQTHFYFQSGKLVIWLATAPALAEQALAETMRFYP